MNAEAPKIKPGECIWCRIEAPEPGGYIVAVEKKGIKGFLPSNQPIEIGRVVPSTFVCMNGEQALFTFAFTMGTSSRVQHSTASDAENAFSVWAEAHPKYNSLRRAVDLVMPPISTSSMMFKMNDKSAKEFFPTLEETKFTGCLKIYCESGLSRAAVIFFEGRVVGSVFTKKPNRDPYSFEIGIRKMLEDLSAPEADADIEMYELPIGIVLSMSSLFLGYSDLPSAEISNMEYAEKMLKHFSNGKDTACFNLIDDKSEVPFAFGFVCDGEFKGTYIISEQIFSEGTEFLLKLMENKSQLKLQTHILPTAMTSESVLFGYSLGSEQFAI